MVSSRIWHETVILISFKPIPLQKFFCDAFAGLLVNFKSSIIVPSILEMFHEKNMECMNCIMIF